MHIILQRTDILFWCPWHPTIGNKIMISFFNSSFCLGRDNFSLFHFSIFCKLYFIHKPPKIHSDHGITRGVNHVVMPKESYVFLRNNDKHINKTFVNYYSFRYILNQKWFKIAFTGFSIIFVLFRINLHKLVPHCEHMEISGFQKTKVQLICFLNILTTPQARL